MFRSSAKWRSKRSLPAWPILWRRGGSAIQGGQSGVETCGIAWFGENSSLTIGDDLRHASDAAADGGFRGAHGFEEDDAEGFIERGGDEDVAAAVELGQLLVGDGAGEGDAGEDGVGGEAGAEEVGAAAVRGRDGFAVASGEGEAERGELAAEGGDDFEESVDALAAFEAAGEEDLDGVRRAA